MGEETTFRDSVGLPAVENKKRLARQKKEKVTAKTFYTISNGIKVHMLTVKPNGCYRSYFGNVKKLGRDLVDLKIKEWKQKGQWLEPHEADSKVNEMIKQMQRV